MLATAASGVDASIAYTATNSGTFTALVSSYYSGQFGTYGLHLAQAPEAFIVAPGNQGGPMTNGAYYAGSNSLGDLSMWSIAANTGDTINLRAGTTNFDGDIKLYGPTGAALASSAGALDTAVTYRTTNSGTFTAVLSSSVSGQSGTYAIYLAQAPEPFVVPPGESGGPMINGSNDSGTIPLGALNMWSFIGNTGDTIRLRLGTTNFDGNLNLYGTNGALLATAASGVDAAIAYTATNSGAFTVVVSSYFLGQSGTYQLHYIQVPSPFSSKCTAR